MIEIQDNAILLHSYKYAYNKHVVSVLTENHGKISGFTKKHIGIPGSLCNILWKARLIDHLGYISIDIIMSLNITRFWSDINKVCTVNAILASANKFIPDRMPSRTTYLNLRNTLDSIVHDDYSYLMAKWDGYLGEKYLGIDTSNIMHDISDMRRYIKKYEALNTRAKLDLASILV